ncbi:MAG TPA: NADP-dependent phosphogluconate dehydrogenase [Aigarchaeota archaeon]|nr:NADP-dependent phosphogluconate dehydrogenase [Aigarchaeota archaeon]
MVIAVMVGGEESGYEQSRELWESIAAKADGEPCAGYMGRAGAGHFVKMTHNGIEYALLQLIAESYDIMTWGLGLSTAEARDVFAEWLDGELRSYLLEITVDALSYLDEETGKPLVELVLDKAEQKGTGKWTSQTALDLGIPTPSIDAAVVARIISSHKQLREKLSRKTVKPRLNELSYVEKEDLIENLKKAFHLSSILSYAQGLHLIKQASNEYSYGTDLINVVKVWRNGCIIRSNLLERIVKALGDDPSMENILLHREFIEIIAYEEQGLRSLLSVVKRLDTPTPVFDASLNYLIALRRGRLPASLIQALRDRFGSHGYERIDKPGRFHSSWR